MRFLVIIVCWMALISNALAIHEKTIYGYVERAVLVENNLTVSAKLDTGAKTASLSAIKITETQVDGKTFLTFLVPTKNGNIPFTCEYAGKVKIKTRVGESRIHSMLKSAMRRPVVIIKIALDGKERLIRVNLTNRKRFIYPLLLGREAIMVFDGIIDPSLKYTTKNKHVIKVMN